MSEHGLFVTVEGGDGSGKGTQSELLANRARLEGLDVFKTSFPRYGEPSALYAGRYLDGKYGENYEVHPELASLTYAIDRFAASSLIRAHIRKNQGPVITDRWVASNLAHQGTKISDTQDRKSFYEETMQLEYETLNIPRADLNIVLLVPSSVAQLNVDKKDARSYTKKKRDIHEADANHLELAKANYEELCSLYPEEFTAIECMQDSSTMRSREEIQADIWKLVEPLL